jgi:hypothetical protein
VKAVLVGRNRIGGSMLCPVRIWAALIEPNLCRQPVCLQAGQPWAEQVIIRLQALELAQQGIRLVGGGLIVCPAPA